MEFVQDLRLAVRRLSQRPGFALAAVAALALGIGSNTAIYSVVQAVLLRPLPYPRADELLSVWETQPGVSSASISAPDFRDWREQARTVDLTAFSGDSFNLTALEHPERLLGAATDARFFQVLQARAALGRTYGPGGAGEVVLSDAAFRRLFGGDPSVVGKTVSIDGVGHPVVGVLPHGVGYPLWAEAWVAASDELPVLSGFDPKALQQRGSHYMRAVGRLRGGATLAQARAELEGIGARLEAAYAGNKDHRPALELLQTSVVGNVSGSLWLLTAGVVLVLLIACANVAGLQLAEAASRQREIATRMALGASRWQLVRQLLAESVLLSLAGGALGLLLSFWGVDALVALSGNSLPRGDEVSIDPGVLGFTLAASMGAGVLGGLLPALLASRAGSLSALKDASPAGFGRARARSALIVAEVALAVVLLAGAGLLLRSFLALRAVDPGFDPHGAVALRLQRSVGKGPADAAPFFEELARRLSALPGARAAGATRNLPLSGSNINGDVSIEGRARAPGERFLVERQVIVGDYFGAMGMRLLSGRAPGPQDGPKSGRVAVVNRAMAERFWPGQDAVGKRYSESTDGPGDGGWIRVVGVVSDVHQRDLGTPAAPEAYVPLAQSPAAQMTFVVRTDGDVGALSGAVRRELAALDPSQPIWRLQPLEELLGASLQARRSSALLLGIFSGLALLLSALGIYAMVAYAVVQRTREIGVRMALGAEAGGVVLLVVRQGMRLALLGVCIGVPAALALGKVISAQLYGVGSSDLATHLAVAAVLSGAALLACWLPARIAARVSPMVALRAE